MNTPAPIQFFDPYKIVDPTRPMPAAVQGRSQGGRFTHRSVLTNAGDNNFPINSAFWQGYARGAWRRLARLTGDAYQLIADRIIPRGREEMFSWRMTCEMLEAACERIESTGDLDIEATVAAAHDFLRSKQEATLRIYPASLMLRRDQLVSTLKELDKKAKTRRREIQDELTILQDLIDALDIEKESVS